MDILHQYIDQLQHMNRAVMQGHKAPHKPILLLAIMDLAEDGVIQDCRIELTDKLIVKFKELWHVLVEGEEADREVFKVAEGLELNMQKKYPFKCNIANPYYYMQHEPFWDLIPNEKWVKRTDYSVAQLKNCFDCAIIDDRFFNLMNDNTTRETIRRTLLEMI